MQADFLVNTVLVAQALSSIKITMPNHARNLIVNRAPKWKKSRIASKRSRCELLCNEIIESARAWSSAKIEKTGQANDCDDTDVPKVDHLNKAVVVPKQLIPSNGKGALPRL